MGHEIILEDDQEHRLLREILEEQRHTNHILRRILLHLDARETYGIELILVGGLMSAGNTIVLGGSVQLVVNLTNNGAVVSPQPAGLAPVVTSSDPDVTSAPATVDATNGATPLNQQFVLTDAATDTVGTVDTITVTMTAPDGSTVTGTLAATIATAPPSPNSFGIALTLEPVPSAASAAVRK